MDSLVSRGEEMGQFKKQWEQKIQKVRAKQQRLERVFKLNAENIQSEQKSLGEWKLMIEKKREQIKQKKLHIQDLKIFINNLQQQEEYFKIKVKNLRFWNTSI